jgi:hypothetical protein
MKKSARATLVDDGRRAPAVPTALRFRNQRLRRGRAPRRPNVDGAPSRDRRIGARS